MICDKITHSLDWLQFGSADRLISTNKDHELVAVMIVLRIQHSLWGFDRYI